MKKRKQNKEYQKEYQKVYRKENRDKLNKISREYYQKNKLIIKERRKGKPEKRNWVKRKAYMQKMMLLRKFGLAIEDYNKLLAEQKGVCAICKLPCKTKKNLAVDHNHETGAVRGLLCISCNTGIGNFKDNKAILKEAIIYLSKYK